MDIPFEQFVQFAKITFKDDLITQFKESLVIESYAVAENISVNAEELQSYSDEYLTSKNLHGELVIKRWLESIHLTQEDYEQFLLLKLFRKKVNDIVISDDQVLDYFNSNLFSFETVRLYKIVHEDEDQSLKIANKIQKSGIDFCYAARRYSEDVETANSFGYAGTLRYAQMEPEIRRAILNTPSRDFVGPIKLDNKYVLVKVDEVIPPILTESLYKEIKNTLFEKWLSNKVKSMDEIKILGEASV